MNPRIRELLLKAGWDGYEALDERNQKFAELIVEECCNRLGKETIRHDGYGYNQHELYRRLREHFGVAK